MISNKLEKAGLDYLLSLFNVSQKLVVQIRRTSDNNNTIDIIATDDSDDSDQPIPIQIPEVIIVISVLLLWCASIIILIRHSELLRIRHRDLPTRSTIEPSVNPNPITSVNHTSEVLIHSKSRISLTSVVTPALSDNRISAGKKNEKLETVSLSIPPIPRKRRNTRSFDLNTLLLTKYPSDKNNDRELLLHPCRIPQEIQRSLLDLHCNSMDNIHRNSMSNLSLAPHSIFHSANDMSKGKRITRNYLKTKKKTTQDLPV